MALHKEYFELLRERAKKSRVYRGFQETGLMLAEILEDTRHRALYIKLAKRHDNQTLLSLAKDVAERSGVKNKGAYFMRVISAELTTPFTISGKSSKLGKHTTRQLALRLRKARKKKGAGA